jgi:hypothetical protein
MKILLIILIISIFEKTLFKKLTYKTKKTKLFNLILNDIV